MSLTTHELFLLPRLRKRRHYHGVSVLCGVPPPLEWYFCFTQRAVWRRVCLLSACCYPMRSSTLPGSSTCLPWSWSCSAPVGDCFIPAHFLLLLHEALVVVGSPALLIHTDVGLAVGSPIWALFPCQTEMYPPFLRACAEN